MPTTRQQTRPTHLPTPESRFNDTTRPYPSGTPIHELFAEQVRRAPEALAVTWRDERLTYAQVHERAELLARRLFAAGVRPGDRVGLRTTRTPELVIGALAILRVGAGYLPLESQNPPERVEFLLADAGVRVVVTVTDLPVDFRFDGDVVLADQPAEAGEPLPTSNSEAGDLAYVCYTSGTTGRPKGVRVSHRNVVRLVRGADYVHFGPSTRILPSGSIAFDAMTFELWGALLNGGSVHLVDNDVVLSARALGAELEAQAITTMWLTSPLFNQLVEQDATAFRSLRELVVGGDALSPRHLAKAMDACPDLVLVNGYGPTENTTFSVTHRLGREDLTRIPIGRPIANSTAYVLDEDGNPCPPGVPGELCLGGDGVALGYLDRPELTAEKFVADPFRAGGRMYRSGDLAQWREDGVIDFLGRRDHQVKVRGFRVEPGEIENALLDHPAVREAIVVARQRAGDADKYLCGYYVGAADQDGLRAHLARTLPDHMVPTYLVELPELPLNHSGKVDRGALPAPEVTGVDHVAASDETERVLVELAERALGLAGIGVGHDLRDLGADSLTATLLAAGIDARLGRRIAVSAVLRSGKLARLAEIVRSAPPSDGPAITAAPDRDTYPLTPQQRQIYFEQLKDTEAVHYNVPVTLELPGVDAQRLADAVRKLARRHDALRTRFVFASGEVRQVIEPDVVVPVEIVDEPSSSFVRPFDLGEAPLWRVEISPGRLRIDLHHVITDGFSLVTMLSELATIYSGREPEQVSARFRDYAVWLESAGPRTTQASFWGDVFARPLAATDLPIDFPRPPIRALDGDVVEFDLGRPRADALRRLAREHDVTLFAVLAAAHGILLAGLTGSADVVLGTPVSGRTVPELHGTLGMFANTVCLRTEAAPALTFAEFLRGMGRTAEDAFAHQDFPFEALVARTNSTRDYRRTPLFDALMALHSSRYLHVDFAGARVPLRFEPTGQSVFDLNMQIYEVGGTLLVAWHYGSRILRRDTVESWRDRFCDVLDTVLTDPATTLGELTTAGSAPEFDFDL